MNTILRLIPLLLIVLTISSCGSITKTTSIIRIDTKEAGAVVTVTDDEGQSTKVLSPALAGVAPGRSIKAQWSQRGKPKKQTSEHSCNWQWGKSIIPNTLPVFGGLPGVAIALVFNGVDYFSGNIFDCSQLISRKGFKNKKKKKIRAFVIPPRLNDAKESLKIALHFRSKKTNPKKMIVVDPEVSKDALANLGINNDNAPANQDLPFKRLRKYGLKAGAEYAILLSIKKRPKREQTIVTPKLINLISEEIKPLKSYKMKNVEESNSFWSALADAINFIPNGLTLSYYNNPRITDREKIESSTRTDTHPDSFPKVINALGMSSVVHPQFMRTWDFSFQTFASVGASAWRKELAQTSSNISGLYILYNAQLTGHFALGAINLDIGYGASTFQIDESTGLSQRKYRSITRLGASYVAFLNHKIFIKMGADQYHINGGIGSTPSSSTQIFYETYFGLGYYFPEIRYLVRDLF